MQHEGVGMQSQANSAVAAMQQFGNTQDTCMVNPMSIKPGKGTLAVQYLMSNLLLSNVEEASSRCFGQ